MNIEPRTYYDCIDDVTIKFLSDAKQSTINALEFNGDWCVVRRILLDCGYKVIENTIAN